MNKFLCDCVVMTEQQSSNLSKSSQYVGTCFVVEQPPLKEDNRDLSSAPIPPSESVYHLPPQSAIHLPRLSLGTRGERRTAGFQLNDKKNICRLFGFLVLTRSQCGISPMENS